MDEKEGNEPVVITQEQAIAVLQDSETHTVVSNEAVAGYLNTGTTTDELLNSVIKRNSTDVAGEVTKKVKSDFESHLGKTFGVAKNDGEDLFSYSARLKGLSASANVENNNDAIAELTKIIEGNKNTALEFENTISALKEEKKRMKFNSDFNASFAEASKGYDVGEKAIPVLKKVISDSIYSDADRSSDEVKYRIKNAKGEFNQFDANTKAYTPTSLIKAHLEANNYVIAASDPKAQNKSTDTQNTIIADSVETEGKSNTELAEATALVASKGLHSGAIYYSTYQKTLDKLNGK